MNVDMMRKVDYYVGIPLAFIGTILDKILNIFRSNDFVKPKNVLLIELSEMGSAIIVDPAMRKLKANIEGELFFVIFSKNKISLDLLKTVKSENVYMLDESSIGSLIISAIKFIFWCRKMKIDSSID